jgi:hypothetical protein
MRALACLLLCGLAAASLIPERASGQDKERVIVEPRFEHDARFVRVGNTTQGVRFKTATGEAWLLVLDRWEKIADGDKLPAGDYDVFLAARDNDFSAYRFDHKTGATWVLADQKWVRVANK